MATGANRDVTLGVGIQTTGEEALKSLAQEVQNLAKRGGDAAPAYEQLANELTRLAEQAGHLESFKALSADVEKLATSQIEAATATSELQTKLTQQREATVALSATQAQALADLKAAKEAIDGKRYALAQLNIDTDRAAKSDDAYLTASKGLKQEILDQSVSLKARRDALADATKAVTAAEAAESKLETQYNRSAKVSDQIATALSGQREAMNRVGAAAEALGADIANVAAAEENLRNVQQELVSGVAQTRVATMREQAEADRLAAIEAQALAEQIENGKTALYAETVAIKEAEAASKQYAATQAGAVEELKRLEAEEARVTEAMRNTVAATTLANEAALASSKNADYLKFWADAADKLAAAEARAAEEAEYLRTASQRASDAMRDAFGQTGVRSLQAVQAEVEKVGQSLVTLQRGFENGSIGAGDLARATSSAQVRLAQLRQEMLSVPSTPNIFERMNSSINDLLGKFGSLAAGLATIGFAVKPVADAAMEFENLRKTLTAVTGSSEAAAQQIDFLRRVAQENGLAVGQLTGEYSNFVASMLKSGQSLETTQGLFKGVAAASNTLGISTERTGLILLALSQTANKGKVSLEEVQKQIGESMPGALKIMADSLGITSAEFVKLVSKGELMSNQFLPALAQGLQDAFGPGTNQTVTLTQAVGRLQTAITTTAQEVADTSSWKALIAVTESVASNIGAITTAVGVMVKGFLAFKAISAVTDFLEIGRGAQVAAAAKADLAAATAANTAATVKESVAEAEMTVARKAGTTATLLETEAVAANTLAKAANTTATTASGGASAAFATGMSKVGEAATGLLGRVGSLTAALGGPYGAALAATIALAKPVGEGIAYIAAKMTGAIGTIEKYEAAERALAAQQQESSRLAADRAAAYVKYLVLYDKMQEAATKAAETSKKVAEAKKVEGEMSVKIAELYGDEAVTRKTAADAALANVDSSQKVLGATTEELRVQQLKLDAILREAGGREHLTSEQAKQVTEIEALIAKYGAERDLARNRLDDLKVEADRRNVAAISALDQSERIDMLRKSRDADGKTLERYTELERQGLVVGTDLNQMRRNLAASENLLATALSDSAAKLQRKVASMQAEYQMLVAKQTVNKVELDAQIKAAELSGNERLATDLKVQSKFQEIDTIRTATAEKVKEANATIDSLEATKNSILGTDKDSEAKRQAIEVSIALQKAKLMEAKASDAVVSGLMAEIDALRKRAVAGSGGSGGGSGGNSGGSGNSGTGTGGNSNGNNNGGASGIDGSGMSSFAKGVTPGSHIGDANNSGPVDASLPFDLYFKQKNGELTADDLSLAKLALKQAKSNASIGGPGSVSLEGQRDDQMWIGRMQSIVDQLQGQANAEAAQAAGFVPGFKKVAPAPAPSSTASPSDASTTHTVNINLNGVTTAVNTASAADSDALTKLLQQLAAAQGRST